MSARSAALGFAHGALVSLGVVAGDLLFIVIAVHGLSLLAEWTGAYFYLVKYFGGAYLVALGIALWRSTATPAPRGARGSRSALASFLAGFAITLADQKAILFYLGLFPAFIDLTRVSARETGVILAVASVAVGGPKLLYAFLAARAGPILHHTRAARAIQAAAGSVLIGAGVFLIMNAPG